MQEAVRLPQWVYCALLAWIVVTTSADLKVTIHPRVHWIVSGLVLVPVIVTLWRTKRRDLWCWWISPFVLLSGILMSMVTSRNPLYDLTQILKIGLILVGTAPIFIANPELVRGAFRGFAVAVWINIGLLLLGLFGLSDVASMMAKDRWGNVLNFPGSLAKVGLSLIVYAGYQAFGGEKLRPSWLAVISAGIAIIFLDGSRTAALALLLGILFLIGILFWERRPRQAILAMTVLSGIVLVLGSLTPSHSRMIQLLLGVSEALQKLETGTSVVALEPQQRIIQSPGAALEPLEKVDSPRMQMLKTGLAEIMAHPILGTGMGTTRAKTAIGEMVVHNSYIQIWADAGILGFAGYIMVVFGWIGSLPKAISVLRQIESVEERATHYGAIFMLLTYGFYGLFHPISSEWSEWILFVIPYAIYRGLIDKGAVPKARAAAMAS